MLPPLHPVDPAREAFRPVARAATAWGLDHLRYEVTARFRREPGPELMVTVRRAPLREITVHFHDCLIPAGDVAEVLDRVSGMLRVGYGAPGDGAWQGRRVSGTGPGATP